MVHGQKDNIIPIKQCEELCNKIKFIYKWCPKNGNHSNILTEYRSKFYSQCNYFIDTITLFIKDYDDRPSGKGYEENYIKQYRNSTTSLSINSNNHDYLLSIENSHKQQKYRVLNSLNAKKFFQVNKTIPHKTYDICSKRNHKMV